MNETPKKQSKFPPWIRVRLKGGAGKNITRSILENLKLNTVCESAGCPNIHECWQRKTATFMILGKYCTRNCKFCAVLHRDNPPPPDKDEALRVAKAAEKLKLKYAVITSVTRDDLPDGGAAHFALVVKELKKAIPGIKVEILTPDFKGSEKSIRTVLDSSPDVFNHNVETVERLSPLIRKDANYRLSLSVLKKATKISAGKIPVKSGLMVGMGESDDEILQAIKDIRKQGAEMLTIGQYLPPSREKHWPIDRFVEPEKFVEWQKFATKCGFSFAACAPLVRSSYNAEEFFNKMKN